MKYAWALGIILVCIVGLALYIAIAFKVDASPSSYGIRVVTVSYEKIVMQGDFFGSATLYAGYRVQNRDGDLYVTIRGTILQFLSVPPTDLYGISVVIPNTYGDIKSIYLQGPSLDDRLLIWKDGKMVDRSQRGSL